MKKIENVCLPSYFTSSKFTSLKNLMNILTIRNEKRKKTVMPTFKGILESTQVILTSRPTDSEEQSILQSSELLLFLPTLAFDITCLEKLAGSARNNLNVAIISSGRSLIFVARSSFKCKDFDSRPKYTEHIYILILIY